MWTLNVPMTEKSENFVAAVRKFHEKIQFWPLNMSKRVTDRKTQFWPAWIQPQWRTGFPKLSHVQWQFYSSNKNTINPSVWTHTPGHSFLAAEVEQMMNISSYQSIAWGKRFLASSTNIFLAPYYAMMLGALSRFRLSLYWNGFAIDIMKGEQLAHTFHTAFSLVKIIAVDNR